MISKQMAEMINEQINLELFSGYFYLEMANYFEEKGLDGFSHWFRVQAREEFSHARIFMNYLQNNEVHVKFKAIKDPSRNFKNDREVLEEFLSHEKDITATINKMFEKAIEEKDYRSVKLLDWFIEEQDEEETSAIMLLEKYKLYSENNLFLLNKEIGSRVYEETTMALD